MLLLIFFSLGEACSHVGGLLLRVEMAVRLGIREEAWTDVARLWNQVTWNGIQPGPLSKIFLHDEETKAKLKKGSIQHAPPEESSTTERESMLLNLIRCKSSPGVGLSLLPATSVYFAKVRPIIPPKRLPHDLSTWRQNPPSDPMATISNITTDEIVYLEESTHSQAG